MLYPPLLSSLQLFDPKKKKKKKEEEEEEEEEEDKLHQFQ